MKYKVKNVTTGEETLCEKVVVDNHDYYIGGSNIVFGDYWVYIGFGEEIEITKSVLVDEHWFNKLWDKNNYKKVIATTNKSLDLPIVIDEVSELAVSEHKYNHKSVQEIGFRLGFEVGYNQAKEIFEYTKEDMVGFVGFIEWLMTKSFREGTSDYTTEELLDIWQEQRTKTILVK